MKYGFSILSFMDYDFGIISEKFHQTQGHVDFLLGYLLVVVHFMFSFLIHFE